MDSPHQEFQVRSSYKHFANFGDILAGIVSAKRPMRHVAEYGILDGFSLDIFDRFSPDDCSVEAMDIFEGFKGNRPRRQQLQERFAGRPKVQIREADFYNASRDLRDNHYDIIHVDIANNGSVFASAVEQLVPKLAPDGILLLEGGSPERDQVAWMIEYQKPPILPVIEKLQSSGLYDVTVLGSFPGLTMVRPIALG